MGAQTVSPHVAMSAPVLLREPCNSTPRGSLVFLHGAGGHHGIWEGVVRALGSLPWLRVRIDLPGHGRARDLPPLHQADLLLTRLQASLQELPPPLLLVGHSMGGRIALALVQAGLPVQGVFLVASLPHLPVFSGGPDPDPDRLCRRLFGLPRWVERCRKHTRRLLEQPDVIRADFRLIEELNRMPLPAQVPGLEAVFGSREHLFTPSQILAFQEHYPDVRLHTLPHVGHMIPLEAPRPLAALIAAWIPRIAGSPA